MFTDGSGAPLRTEIPSAAAIIPRRSAGSTRDELRGQDYALERMFRGWRCCWPVSSA